MMCINTPSHVRQLLIVGIVSILALISGGPRCSLALDGRRLLEGGFDAGQLQLIHWSHPEAPHHVPGFSFTERLQLSVMNSRNRVAALSSSLMHLSGAPAPAPSTLDSGAPAPGPSNLDSEAPAPGPSNLDFVAPLYNLGYEYATEISIGTPSRKYSVLVDTGSDLVWVECKGCEGCPISEPKFNPKRSSSYRKMSCADPLCLSVEESCLQNKTCDYQYDYGAGDTSGVMSYETITLLTTRGTTTAAKRFAFGCCNGLIVPSFAGLDVDGLLGLGRGPLSLTSQVGSLYGNKFSYCLVSTYDSNSSTSPLLFGDAAVPNAPIQYTPIVQNPNASYFGAETFYYIGLKGINVNEVALDIPSGTFDILPNGTGGVIVDSGTTFTVLTTVAYVPLLAKMQSLIKYEPVPFSNSTVGLDVCYDLANVSNPTFPNITIVFEGFSLELPPDNVFIRGESTPESNSTVYCLGIQEGYGFCIFGNFQQQNFQILFDREAERYGFAKVQCDRLSSG